MIDLSQHPHLASISSSIRNGDIADDFKFVFLLPILLWTAFLLLSSLSLLSVSICRYGYPHFIECNLNNISTISRTFSGCCLYKINKVAQRILSKTKNANTKIVRIRASQLFLGVEYVYRSHRRFIL
jgi:hypothetical protein